MRRTARTGFTLATLLAGAVLLWPAEADAQRYPYPPPYPYGYGWRHDDRADLRLQGTPREAEVYVDGYFVGIVDDFDGWTQRLRVVPGEHEIKVYLPGHRVRAERMRFLPHESYRLQFSLEPLGPGEAEEPRPTPSAEAPRPGYGRPAGPPARRAAQGALGRLSVRVQPADAIVIIDGERWDWPEDSDRLEVELPEGQHRVEVQREGLRPYVTTVDVKRGEVTALNVSLVR